LQQDIAALSGDISSMAHVTNFPTRKATTFLSRLSKPQTFATELTAEARRQPETVATNDSDTHSNQKKTVVDDIFGFKIIARHRRYVPQQRHKVDNRTAANESDTPSDGVRAVIKPRTVVLTGAYIGGKR
jgi:hypothetical protein